MNALIEQANRFGGNSAEGKDVIDGFAVDVSRNLVHQAIELNISLQQHIEMLSELSRCVKYIKALTHQLKQQRRAVRQEDIQIGQIFPSFL